LRLLTHTGLWLVAAFALGLTPAAHAQLYVSPKDDGVAGAGCIPIGAGDKTLALWLNAGSTATQPAGAACDGTGGTLAGQEICMFDYHIAADPNITIVSFAPDPGSGIGLFHNVQGTFIRFNGGDPLLGTLGPVRVGELVANASGAGDLTVVGEGTIDTLLSKNPVSGTLASAGPDGDVDTLCDIEDPCPVFANAIPVVDTDGDGLPNDCQCGDYNGDGLRGFDDATCAGQCFLGGGTAPPPCSCFMGVPFPGPSGLADTNNDGLFGFDDATNAGNAFLTGDGTGLTCTARPTAGPTP